MKYFAFFLCAFLFACQSADKEEKKDPNQDKISSLETEIQNYDSIILIAKDFELSLKNIELYSSKWVTDQSAADNPDKLKLLAAEKECVELLSQMTQKCNAELKDASQEIKENLDELLAITAEIKKTLPDFASYEDVANSFLAQVLISVDGDFYIVFRKIQYALQAMMDRTIREKTKTHLQIEKLKRQ